MYDVCFSYFSYTYIHFIRANCYKLKVLDIPMVTISLNRPLNNELHCTVLHYREPPGAGNRGVLLGLGLYCVAFLAVYLVVPNPLVFQVAARCAVLYHCSAADDVRDSGGGDDTAGLQDSAAAVLTSGDPTLHSYIFTTRTNQWLCFCCCVVSFVRRGQPYIVFTVQCRQITIRAWTW